MKKEILIPALLLLLGLLFIIINIIVYFTKGHPWIVSKKLKVGALILTLTGIVACHTIPKPTCYEPVQTKDNNESNDNLNKKDSINTAKNKKQKDDSIAKINSIKRDSIIPTCYEMPAPRNDKPKKK